MSFADDFGDMVFQTVVWKPLASRDEFGKPTYGASQTFKGRRVFKRKRVAGFSRAVKGEGVDVISDSEIIILGTPDIGYDDQVYIQGDSEPYPPIVNIQRTPDEKEDVYVKVVFGSANG